MKIFTAFILIVMASTIVEGCGWLGPIPGMTLKKGQKKKLSKTTIEKCQGACEEETAFKCRAIAFQTNNKQCFLYNEYSDTQSLKGKKNMQYFERDIWAKEIDGYGLKTKQAKTQKNVKSIGNCRKLCIKEKKFKCMAVEHKGKQCKLYKGNSYTDKMKTKKGWKYQEIRKYNEPVKGMAIGSKKKRVKGNVSKCKKSCLKEKKFKCTSFDFHLRKNYCDLTAESTLTRPLNDDPDIDYYEVTSCN